ARHPAGTWPARRPVRAGDVTAEQRLPSSASRLAQWRWADSRKNMMWIFGVLPDWTAHRGDVRCGGRPHGESSTEGGRTAGVWGGVKGGGGPAPPPREKDA